MHLTKEVENDPVAGTSRETTYLHTDSGERYDVAELLSPRTSLPWGLIAKLHAAGVHDEEALRALSDEEILDLPGVGPKALEEIRGAGE